MESHGGGDNNGKHPQLQPLVRQNSMYNLTFDEFQNQLGDFPLGSMNIDELLRNLWTLEANQFTSVDIEGITQTDQAALQRQVSSALSRTVDEVWRDIQQSEDNNNSQGRPSKLGDMTLENFLVKAGIFPEIYFNRMNIDDTIGVDSSVETPQFPPHSPWIQYAQPRYAQQGLMDIYMSCQNIGQPLQMGAGAGAASDGSYADAQVALSSPIVGTLPDTGGLGRKRAASADMVEKTVDKKQKRMIKNRESAARSRARKQAYTIELEHRVSFLEEENEKLRRQQALEKVMSSAPPPKPRYQIRRTSSAPF